MGAVYDDYRAKADQLIADALATTDSQAERMDILTAFRDALAAFDPPLADVAMPTDPIPAAAPPKKGKKAAGADPVPTTQTPADPAPTTPTPTE